MIPPHRHHLTILRPSPTTISYTLSTRSKTTWHHTITFLLRCVLFLTAVLVCLFRLGAGAADERVVIPPSWRWWWWWWWSGVGVEVEIGVGLGTWGSMIMVWIKGLSWMIVAPVAGLAFFVVFRRFHVGESSSRFFF